MVRRAMRVETIDFAEIANEVLPCIICCMVNTNSIHSIWVYSASNRLLYIKCWTIDPFS
jgi:hypothetical protein